MRIRMSQLYMLCVNESTLSKTQSFYNKKTYERRWCAWGSNMLWNSSSDIWCKESI